MNYILCTTQYMFTSKKKPDLMIFSQLKTCFTVCILYITVSTILQQIFHNIPMSALTCPVQRCPVSTSIPSHLKETDLQNWENGTNLGMLTKSQTQTVPKLCR